MKKIQNLVSGVNTFNTDLNKKNVAVLAIAFAFTIANHKEIEESKDNKIEIRGKAFTFAEELNEYVVIDIEDFARRVVKLIELKENFLTKKLNVHSGSSFLEILGIGLYFSKEEIKQIEENQETFMNIYTIATDVINSNMEE